MEEKPREDTCGKCRWYDPDDCPGRTGEQGQCGRYPPHIVGEGHRGCSSLGYTWPPVSAKRKSCGEFKAKGTWSD